MRGTPLRGMSSYVRTGIIPAYAGNTSAMQAPICWQWDHPRVCGEHHTNLAKTADRQGSSPRMRGTQAPCDFSGPSGGIIPAYAGNTRPLRERSVAIWDHPRVCGEHLSEQLTPFRNRGSSPRMRGTRIYRLHHGQVWGIIPAYAGNTGLLVCPCANGGDHPRVCGEHQKLSLCRHVLAGSSPRMRGTPVRVRQW